MFTLDPAIEEITAILNKHKIPVSRDNVAMGVAHLLGFIEKKTNKQPQQEEEQEPSILITLRVDGHFDEKKNTLNLFFPDPENEIEEDFIEMISDLAELWIDQNIEDDKLSLCVIDDSGESVELDREEVESISYKIGE